MGLQDGTETQTIVQENIAKKLTDNWTPLSYWLEQKVEINGKSLKKEN